AQKRRLPDFMACDLSVKRREAILCSTVLAVGGLLNQQRPAHLQIPVALIGSAIVGGIAVWGGVQPRDLGANLNKQAVLVGLINAVPPCLLVAASALDNRAHSL